MRSFLLFSCRCLAMMWLLGSATAGEAWVEVGELHFFDKSRIGKVSVNLESMRRRERYYEVWERISFVSGVPGQAADDADLADRLTLWAIRCRRGAMAKVTERVAGAFLPRNESLSFHFPSPQSAGLAVIGTACAEARRRFAQNQLPRNEETPPGAPGSRAALERPPSILTDDLDLGDE